MIISLRETIMTKSKKQREKEAKAAYEKQHLFVLGVGFVTVLIVVFAMT